LLLWGPYLLLFGQISWLANGCLLVAIARQIKEKPAGPYITILGLLLAVFALLPFRPRLSDKIPVFYTGYWVWVSAFVVVALVEGYFHFILDKPSIAEKDGNASS